MKYVRLVFINLAVLLGLLLIISIIGYVVTAQRINSFFEMKGTHQVQYLQKDSLAMFVHLPNIQIYDAWGTPQQKLSTERRTNNLGFREDEDIVNKRSDEFRILVTGDSHTDGVLKHNTQSFVNIWEAQLNVSDRTTYYNCINGGVAYYSFRNYAGFLKKYLYLKPDVFVITVFTGNDFREVSLYEDDRTSISNVYQNAYVQLTKRFFTAEMKAIPNAQGIDQLLYFSAFPEEKEKSLRIAKQYLKDIKTLCTHHEIQLVVALLPSKLETNDAFRSKIQTVFKLDDEHMQINTQLTQHLIQWLNSEQILNYNLQPLLASATEKVYWDADLHINTAGHRMIGDFLFDRVSTKEFP